MFNKVAAVVLAAAVLGAHAQSSAATAPGGIPSGITTCSLGCIQQSLSAGNCQAITDLQCLCTSQEFQQAAATCLQSQCPDDVAAASAVQQQQCAALGISSASGASSTAPPSASSSGASSTGGSASSRASSASSVVSGALSSASSIASSLSSALSPSTTGGNNNGAVAVNKGGLAGLAVAALGVVAGAGLIL